jgi:hypothetical protein
MGIGSDSFLSFIRLPAAAGGHLNCLARGETSPDWESSNSKTGLTFLPLYPRISFEFHHLEVGLGIFARKDFIACSLTQNLNQLST